MKKSIRILLVSSVCTLFVVLGVLNVVNIRAAARPNTLIKAIQKNNSAKVWLLIKGGGGCEREG